MGCHLWRCSNTVLNNKTITATANSAPMTWSLDHLSGYPSGWLRKVVSQVIRPSRENALGHTRVFFYRAGWPTSHTKFHKLASTQGCQLCHGCLCWRCTQAGSNWWTDVILPHWALLVQGWPNTTYYWGGLHSVAPTGGSPCSGGTPTLVSANPLVRKELNYWMGRNACMPWTD